MMSSISRKRRHSPEAYITSNRTNLNRWEPDHLLLRANTPSSDARASESYRTDLQVNCDSSYSCRPRTPLSPLNFQRNVLHSNFLSNYSLHGKIKDQNVLYYKLNSQDESRKHGATSSSSSSSSNDDSKEESVISMIYTKSGSNCKVCWNPSIATQITTCCNTSFCLKCLNDSLSQRQRCPSCSVEICKSRSAEVPQVIDGFLPPLKANQTVPNTKEEFTEFKKYDEFSLSILLSHLQKLRDEKHKANRPSGANETLSYGLSGLIQSYKRKLNELSEQMTVVIADKNTIDGGYKSLCSLYNGVYSSIGAHAESLQNPHFERDRRLRVNLDNVYNHVKKITLQTRATADSSLVNTTSNRLSMYTGIFEGVAKYGEIRKITTIKDNIDRLVTDIRINFSGKIFALASAGVSLFDTNHLIETSQTKECSTCLKDFNIVRMDWSSFEENIFSCASTTGRVMVYDINSTGNVIADYNEHESRVFCVALSKQNPKLLLSAGHDGMVKLYNYNCPRSVHTFGRNTPITSVAFHPTKRNALFYAAGDGSIYLHDIRNLSNPTSVLTGTKKAISCAYYLNSEEIIASSVDGVLRLWDVNEKRCTNSMEGHENKKNFCGLTFSGDHILMGSEKNEAVLYYKCSTKPLTRYEFPRKLIKRAGSLPYVGALAWVPDSDYIIAGSSMGPIELLQTC